MHSQNFKLVIDCHAAPSLLNLAQLKSGVIIPRYLVIYLDNGGALRIETAITANWLLAIRVSISSIMMDHHSGPAINPPAVPRMTFVSNDPSFWPLISFYRVSSYCVGSSTPQLMMVISHVHLRFSQLHPLLRWYMIGVSHVAKFITFLDGIIDVTRSFSSASVRTRGTLLSWPEGALSLRILYIVWPDLGE